MLQPSGTREPTMLLSAPLLRTEVFRFLHGSYVDHGQGMSFHENVSFQRFFLWGFVYCKCSLRQNLQALHPDMF